jgi:hypothetical protein
MVTRCSYLSRSSFYKKPYEAGRRKWLIAELNKYTSRIVRRRDGRCVTCGTKRNLQCSHFYSRRYLAIRFNLLNRNAMCGRCNRHHNYDPFPYISYVLGNYGSEAVEALNRLRSSHRQVTDDDLRRTRGAYQAMC